LACCRFSISRGQGTAPRSQLAQEYNIVYNIVNDILSLLASADECGANQNGCRSSMTSRASRRRPPVVEKRHRSQTAKTPSLPELRRQERGLADKIATRLEEDIVLGRRHPRERLVEQDLCDRFKTHRADVRLALFELEKKGIVQRIPNRGAIVRDLTPEEVMEIYAVREELEVMAARILPFPIAEAELTKLDQLQRQHSAAIDDEDMLTVFYTNLYFHQTLFGLCGNACLIETIRLLEQKVYGIRFYANAFPQALDQARRDHLEMVKALRTARRDDLIALTRSHLKPSPQAYIRAYERRFGSSPRA
jgi:DNA-binding GntR family transcriptional regulator